MAASLIKDLKDHRALLLLLVWSCHSSCLAWSTTQNANFVRSVADGGGRGIFRQGL